MSSIGSDELMRKMCYCCNGLALSVPYTYLRCTTAAHSDHRMPVEILERTVRSFMEIALVC